MFVISFLNKLFKQIFWIQKFPFIKMKKYWIERLVIYHSWDICKTPFSIFGFSGSSCLPPLKFYFKISIFLLYYLYLFSIHKKEVFPWHFFIAWHCKVVYLSKKPSGMTSLIFLDKNGSKIGFPSIIKNFSEFLHCFKI